VRLSAVTRVSLTASALTGSGVTFTASGPAFSATADVGARLLFTAGGIARVTAVVSPFVVTADIEGSTLATLLTLAGAWHLAPPWNWIFRYPKPTDFLRLTETQCSGWWNNGPIFWSWWVWGWRGTFGEIYREEPARPEGEWIVSNAGPTLDIEYAASVTDPARFDPSFRSCLAALLAARVALPLTKDKQVMQLMEAAFERELKAVRTADKLDAVQPPKRVQSLLNVRF